MKKSSFKKTVWIAGFILLFFGFNQAYAEQNIISSVAVSKAKDTTGGYELNVDSTQMVSYKTHLENDDEIYFDLKNSTVSPEMNTFYEDVAEINTVTVKQQDSRVRIYIKGKNVKNTELIFINSLFDTTLEPNKKIIINRPINEYKSTNYASDLENQEDNIQDWDDNSFNLSHLALSALGNLKDNVNWVVLTVISFIVTLIIIVKTITAKFSQDGEPLVGLNNYDNDKSYKTPYQPQIENYNDDTKKKLMTNAKQELKKAHQKYQDYLQSKYHNSLKPRTIDFDAIKTSIALSQYQKNNQNPYLDQEVIKIKKDSIQIPPRPKAQVKQEFTNPYIQRKSPSYQKKDSKSSNMKFLESVTKIYEQSGRNDLADELKNSILKAKQSI